jgi:hypothetical protein
MRALARPNTQILLFLLSFLLPHPAFAVSYAAVIKYAHVTESDEYYLMSAEIEYKLSPKATEALKNGVPLHWEVNIRVKRHRSFWWDEKLVDKNLRFRIQYQALLNTYRVHNEDTGESNDFSTLSAALDALSTIRYIPLVNRMDLIPGNSYGAGIRVKFDHELLPLPLRPLSYINSQWYLSSNWYLWNLIN